MGWAGMLTRSMHRSIPKVAPMPAVATHTMTTDTPGPHLLALLTWLSPAFPTGAYAYSHGLEWAVET